MLPTIPSEGHFFSAKKQQIKRMNALVKKINTGTHFDEEQARKYYLRLCNYYWHLMSNGLACAVVRQWFQDNPLYKIEKFIDNQVRRKLLMLNLKEITSSANLLQVYAGYEGKDSFRSRMINMLHDIDPEYTAENLGGENNPVLKVSKEDECFICRFFRVNAEEDDKEASQRFARDRLKEIPYVVQPYELIFLENDGHEKIYLEFTEYLENGTMEAFFKWLHEDYADDEIAEMDELHNIALMYCKDLLNFYTLINECGVWYTDLKPSNILLNEEGAIRLSDAKGLILSDKLYVPICQANLTQEYHATTAYKGNQLNLLVLQRQNFACTLYELLTNQLPEQTQCTKDGAWFRKNKFDFSHPVFAGRLGNFFKHMIKDMHNKAESGFEEYLEEINTLEQEMETSFSEFILPATGSIIRISQS